MYVKVVCSITYVSNVSMGATSQILGSTTFRYCDIEVKNTLRGQRIKFTCTCQGYQRTFFDCKSHIVVVSAMQSEVPANH